MSRPLRVLVAGGILFLSVGCGTLRRGGGGASGAGSREEAPRYRPARHEHLGYVLSFDPASGTALAELSPLVTPPENLPERNLLARDAGTLAPTARLRGSPFRQGRVIGVYVLEGAPRKDDEIVIVPEY